MTGIEPASTLAQPDPWVDHFKFEGKTYKIFKRNRCQAGRWYVHYQIYGKRHPVSSNTNIKDAAIKFFKKHIAAAKARRTDALPSVKLTGKTGAPAFSAAFEAQKFKKVTKRRDDLPSADVTKNMVSSTLGEHLREMRTRRRFTQEQLANHAKCIGRSTVAAIEQGLPVKLDTLRAAVAPLQLSNEEWQTLLIDWLRMELGPEFQKLEVRPRDADALYDSDSASVRLQRRLSDLAPSAQEHILQAIENPEVRAAIPFLNRIASSRKDRC